MAEDSSELVYDSGLDLTSRNPARLGACPPVVQYSREFQAPAGEELVLLPEGSVIVEMLSDYAVVRDQGRTCTALP